MSHVVHALGLTGIILAGLSAAIIACGRTRRCQATLRGCRRAHVRYQPPKEKRHQHPERDLTSRSDRECRWTNRARQLECVVQQTPTSSARAVNQMVSYHAASAPLHDPHELRSCGEADGQLPRRLLTSNQPEYGIRFLCNEL